MRLQNTSFRLSLLNISIHPYEQLLNRFMTQVDSP